MSHEDYARWLLALNYFLGPLPKFIDKYPKFSTAFVLNLTHGHVTFTHEQVAKKVLNDTIANKLVKFKFARQRRSRPSSRRRSRSLCVWGIQSNNLLMATLS